MANAGEAAAQAENLVKVHQAFATKFKADTLAANKKALASTASFAGFSTQDIANFLSVSPAEALKAINAANGQGTLDPRFASGLQHLAEHPKGSHYSGDFNVGNNVLRAGAAITTGGFSELARDKPFQPGGGNAGNVLQNVPGVGTVTSVIGAAKKATTPPGIPAPATPPPAPNQAAARAALDKADAERRRQLATSPSTTGGLGLPGDATVKRSVLG